MDRLEGNGKKIIPFEKSPVCGGKLTSKKVEKLLRSGGNTVSLRVDAEVCEYVVNGFTQKML